MNGLFIAQTLGIRTIVLVSYAEETMENPFICAIFICNELIIKYNILYCWVHQETVID